MKTKCAGKTITGRRQSNQDALCLEPDWGLYVVADGMGGYKGGEIAAGTAIKAIREFFRANEEDDCVTWPFGLCKDLTFTQNMVRVAIRSANYAVMQQRTGELANMGSTVAVLALREGRAIIAHMGDSRIYRVRDSSLTQLTRDHSMYNALSDSGARDLGPPDEFVYRNVVTRALGFTTSAGDEPELGDDSPRAGDVYLLCTDGLYERIDEGVIVGVVEASKTLEQACETLISVAYERGSTDNITAVLVGVES